MAAHGELRPGRKTQNLLATQTLMLLQAVYCSARFTATQLKCASPQTPSWNSSTPHV